MSNEVQSKKLRGRPWKLPSGEWGVLTSTPADVGYDVEVTANNGKRWQTLITDVVESRGGGSLCRTTARPASRSHRRSTRTGCSCGSVEEFEKDTDCWTCRHDR